MTQTAPSIDIFNNSVITTPSFTNPNISYTIEKGQCNCPSFAFGVGNCKHIKYFLPKVGMYKVPSETYDGVFYDIDILNKTCSCPGFFYSKKNNKSCKHIAHYI